MAPEQDPSAQNFPRVAVAGCGYWGQNLVRVFHSLGALHSICEPVGEAQQRAARIAPGVPIINEFDELLNRSEIDAIVIATPAATHAELVRKALSADKHVFVEKPLAMSVEDGERIVALADFRKRIVMVGHILTYHPAVTKLKRLIDNGELGKILYINSHRLNFGKIRREENILWSFAPHDISTILMLLQESPSSLTCSGGEYIQSGIYDLTLTNLEFAGGQPVSVP
jgi:UDP-2-acetamido-3-amino-2,3-dideoxy-glucuronate N-acetyltransferase